MTVEVLRLTGMTAAKAAGAAADVLGDVGKYPDLGRLLVIDDTARLVEHALVYGQLLSARFRVGTLLCVAVGPRHQVGHDEKLLIPANVGGEESPVLWVGDPSGVDWRLADGEIATGHASYSGKNGLDELVYLLSFDDVFTQVRETSRQLPDGVASPGLRLAGVGDEASSFATALAIAIGRLGADGRAVPARRDEPLPVSGLEPAGGAGLAEGGELARLREQVMASITAATDEAGQLAGIGGLLAIGRLDPAARIAETGAALAAFRTRVARLLTEVGTLDGLAGQQLTDKQRRLVSEAGVLLPTPPVAANDAEATDGTPDDWELSSVFDAIIEAVRRGETLPQVAARLSATERGLLRDVRGKGALTPAEACPDEVLHSLAEPPRVPRPGPWAWLAVFAALVVIAVPVALKSGPAPLAGGIVVAVAAITAAAWSWEARVAAWRRRLALQAARQATEDLANLVTTVAAAQWSGSGTLVDEVTRGQNTLDGIVKELVHHAVAPPDPGLDLDVIRATRQADVLLPYLRTLVIEVLTRVAAETTVNGEPALELARVATGDLLKQWIAAARQHGALARPPFVPETAKAVAGSGDGELTSITSSVRYDPTGTMWQLCGHGDLDALDVAGEPQVVTFAPRLSHDALNSVLPKETIWLPVGQCAGLLRLVPLLPASRHRSWVSEESSREPLT